MPHISYSDLKTNLLIEISFSPLSSLLSSSGATSFRTFPTFVSNFPGVASLVESFRFADQSSLGWLRWKEIVYNELFPTFPEFGSCRLLLLRVLTQFRFPAVNIAGLSNNLWYQISLHVAFVHSFVNPTLLLSLHGELRTAASGSCHTARSESSEDSDYIGSTHLPPYHDEAEPLHAKTSYM